MAQLGTLLSGFLAPRDKTVQWPGPQGPVHHTGVLDTEADHTMKWKNAQSPVVSCTAVFTGASSLKTDDILRRVVTTFSTSDVSV